MRPGQGGLTDCAPGLDRGSGAEEPPPPRPPHRPVGSAGGASPLRAPGSARRWVPVLLAQDVHDDCAGGAPGRGQRRAGRGSPLGRGSVPEGRGRRACWPRPPASVHRAAPGARGQPGSRWEERPVLRQDCPQRWGPGITPPRLCESRPAGSSGGWWVSSPGQSPALRPGTEWTRAAIAAWSPGPGAQRARAHVSGHLWALGGETPGAGK